MKVSYLIIAHNNYKHLERLIEQLSDDNSRIYIHIDKKSPLPGNLQIRENVFFVPNRVKAYWGGFSLCQAYLTLIEYALNDNFGDYYAVISGSDYPLRANSELYKKLEEGGEFINILSRHKHITESRFVNYHFDTFDRLNLLNPKTLLYYLLELVLRVVLPKKKPPFKLFMGSAWFILSSQCLNFIMNTYNADARYQKFFRNTFGSDECLFHTIIGNSEYYKNVKPNLTYTHWKKGKWSPSLITANQVEIIRNNDTFTGIYGTFKPHFARKFSDDSGDVIALIKQTLHK